MNKFIVSALALALALVLGCEGTTRFKGECTTNSDCSVGSFCRKSLNATSGVCACKSDEACAAGEVCNTQNVCQKRQACRDNTECTEGKFCDLASGNCVAPTSCGADVHCGPGQICDTTRGTCAEGCYDHADCPLYSVCEGGDFSRSAEGRCVRGKCGDKTFCAYGEVCRNGACVEERNPTLCAACEPAQRCGDPNNYCLVNSAYDPRNPASGTEHFCGVGCNDEAECPNGYQCGGVILLTQNPCTGDADCGGGGRRCVIGEGDLRGFCTCTESADCGLPETLPGRCTGTCGGLGLQPCDRNDQCLSGNCVRACDNPRGQRCTVDSECAGLEVCRAGLFGGAKVCATDGITPCNSARDCVCSGGKCVQTGRTCATAADCDIACVDNGCLLGSACAPVQGLLCPDVRVP